MESPIFYNIEEECIYWKEKANHYYKECIESRQEFDEFVENSQQLEAEMEVTLEQKEKIIRDLRNRIVVLEKENESLRLKFDSMGIEFSNVEKQLTAIEQKNDDQVHRILGENLTGFEGMLDKAHEDNALLEMEADEKEIFPEKLQRFMDEVRGRFYHENTAAAQVFAEEIGLIPSRKSTLPLCCGVPMKVETRRSAKLGWSWRCNSRLRPKRRSRRKVCRKQKNPSEGTFFDGVHCRISIRDVLFIVMSFVADIKVTSVIKALNVLRKECFETEVSPETVVDYYRFCREIAEIIMWHENIRLVGKGKSKQIDKAFLTKSKYNRFRITNQYRCHFFKQYKDDGSKMKIFFEHIKMIYPGYVDGVLQQGLKRKDIDSPTVFSEGIKNLLPSTSNMVRMDIFDDFDLKEESEDEDHPLDNSY